MMTPPLTPHQARVEALRLLAEHDGVWSWYQLDRAFDVSRLPPGYRLSQLLEDLESAGYLRSEPADGPPRLHVTDAGRAWLVAPPPKQPTGGRKALQRLRELLTASAGADRQVSQRVENHFFDDDSAAEADITVRRDGRIVLAVVEDALPRERDNVVRTWLRFADEVWIVDLRGRAVIVARPAAPPLTRTTSDTLTTEAVPGLTIALAEIFA
jgi:hypothetical protein